LGKLALFINDEIDKMNTLAIQDYHAENYAQAQTGFNTILGYNPNNKQAYYYLGMIAYNQKNYEKAISDLNKALADTLTAEDVKILRSLSDAYRDKGEKNLMISTLVKIANLTSDEELWLSIANLYAENKQNAKAEEALLEAMKIDPRFMKAQYRMAFLLYDDGKFNEAIPYLEKSAVENPDNDLIARRLAFAYQKAGRISEAIARYENLIISSPSNINAYLNLAGLYRVAATDASDTNNQALVTEFNQKSINTLNKLKAIDTENAIMYLRFADVYLSMNNNNDAEASANSALSKDPTLYQPYVILATVNQRRGTEKYNQFIDLDKQFQKAYGSKADKIAKERDASRLTANSSFRKAEEQLKAAKVRTNEPEVISDLDNKLASVTQLIAQTGKAY
jgi:tetratricopeptide (TPR) repeat protein